MPRWGRLSFVTFGSELIRGIIRSLIRSTMDTRLMNSSSWVLDSGSTLVPLFTFHHSSIMSLVASRGRIALGNLPRSSLSPLYWVPRILTYHRRRFSPSNHVDKWSTPELIIHGSRDYRLPETDGIAAFHALQQWVLILSYNFLGYCWLIRWPPWCID